MRRYLGGKHATNPAPEHLQGMLATLSEPQKAPEQVLSCSRGHPTVLVHPPRVVPDGTLPKALPLDTPSGCFHPIPFGARSLPRGSKEPFCPRAQHHCSTHLLEQPPLPSREVTADGGLHPPEGGILGQ